ncbi:MAG: DNA primase [Bacteroidetes bacterium]|jgi:DNA primase|nr:DNA primase [Bacteroidota bacterium]
MYIPDDKLEEVRAASDIVDVVSDYVKLKKRGSNYFGLCPFHNEKTPSFSVNPSMGIFKCFGCHEGGDVFSFISKIENIGFTETVRLLAERAGIPLPVDEAQREQSSEVESIYHALRFAARFFYKQLTQTDAGQPALEYLKGRGFTATTIKRFGLGYAPDRWDALLNAAEEEHVTPETLEKAGLVLPRKNSDGYYDRFRGRVIFPIFSHVGKVLGFGGRILSGDSDQPKYINSPETKVYSKSRVLYGLYQGKQAIRQAEEVLLVEGYTDVIALHQAGVENVVASSGTALTEKQIKVLNRYAKRILLLYDADNAGMTAAVRGIDLVLAHGLAPYAVSLPAGEDPDSYVQTHGGEAFEAMLDEERQDFVTFLHAQAERQGLLDTPEDSSEAQRSVLETIASIPEERALDRDAYLRHASEVFGVYESDLRREFEQIVRQQQQKNRARRRRSQAQQAASASSGDPRPASARSGPSQEADAAPADQDPEPVEPLPEEKMLLRLMLEHGTRLVEAVLGHMALDEFTEGPSRRIVEHLIEMYQEDAVDKQPFLDGTLGSEIQRLATEVMVDRYAPSENWSSRQNITVPRMNDDPYEAAASAMTLLKLDRVNEAIERQRERLYQATRHDDSDLTELQTEMMELHELRKHIEQRAFLTWDVA